MRSNLHRECSSPRIQTQGDIGTNHFNTQKAWKALSGHPQPAGQAGCLYALRERGASLRVLSEMPSLTFSPVLFSCSGSLLSPHVLSRSSLLYHARPHLPPENRIYHRSNALRHPYMSRPALSPPKIRKPPQPQRTSTCSSAPPTSQIALIYSQIGRHPRTAAREATPNLHLRCCKTALRCRRSWRRS
jgi:hypothetical protein